MRKQSTEELDREIEELERELMGDAVKKPEKQVEVKEEEVVEPTPRVSQDSKELVSKPEQPSQKEQTFEKRYGDLRRFSQQKEAELTKQIEALKKQVEGGPKPSATLEEVKQWVNTNPKAAAFIQEIAKEQISQEASSLEERINELKKSSGELEREREMSRILNAHPDFNEITRDDEFHTWASTQPQRVQDMIYDSPAQDVIWALSLYKKSKSKPVRDNDMDAATAVNSKSASPDISSRKEVLYTESQVEAMSSSEYEEHEEAIQKAIKAGKFKYDITRPADG